MGYLARQAATCAIAAVIVVACAKVPVTKRVQYNLLPDSLMRGVGKTTYTATIAEAKVKRKGEDAEVLTKVGRKISRVANQPKYDWRFSLLDDDQINAWCLPGGYIGFYTGILPVLKSEAGMAFVMGHEVGHATAQHGAERLTQQLSILGGVVGLEAYLRNSTRLDPKQRGILLGALGLGATVGVVLPFSRMHESEADVIGLMYMSRAGYPPAESIDVWTRMEQIAGSSPLPAFLSTHPSNKKRKAKLREWMPKAKKRYTRNKLSYDSLKPLWSERRSGTHPSKR